MRLTASLLSITLLTLQMGVVLRGICQGFCQGFCQGSCQVSVKYGDLSVVPQVGGDSTTTVPQVGGDHSIVPQIGGDPSVVPLVGGDPKPRAPAPQPFEGPALDGKQGIYPPVTAPPKLVPFVQLPAPVTGSGRVQPSAPPESQIISGLPPNSFLAMEGDRPYALL